MDSLGRQDREYTRRGLIPIEAESHHMRLGAKLKTHEKYVPCLQIDEVDWFSDDEAEREQAADWCAGCPVLQQCGDYAKAAKERWGVWAGLDRTRPRNRRKATPDA